MGIELFGYDCFMSFSVHPKTPRLSKNYNDTTFMTNKSVELTCETDSTGNVTYMFYRNDTNLTAALTTNKYSLSSPNPKGLGSYYCVVFIDGVESKHSNEEILNFVGKFSN